MNAAGLDRDPPLHRGPHRADAGRRRLHGARVPRRARPARLRRAPAATALLGVDPARGQDWKGYARSVLDRQRRLRRPALRADPRTQGVLPRNPQDLGAPHLGPVVQHGGLVPHEHELAVLRGRDDDVLPHPDGRPGRPELHLGGRRHRGARRLRPRRSPRRSGSEIGVFYVDLTRAILYVLLPLVDRRRPRPRLPGRASRRSRAAPT